MGGFDRVIVNEIIGNDINIFRLDCDFSRRPEIIYGIDSPYAADIQLYTEKGPVKFEREGIGSRTVIKFKNPNKYYVLAYSKPGFIKNEQGIYQYKDVWAASGETLMVFGLPAFSVINYTNYGWSTFKTEDNHLVLDNRISDNSTIEINYHVDSVKFSEQDIPIIGEQLSSQISFMVGKDQLKEIILKSERLLDWLQRFQALASFAGFLMSLK